MFTTQINSWRIPNIANKIMPVQGNSISSKEKLKLFEGGINYIITSRATAKELINEILGFSPSHCEAFKKLGADSSWFFPDPITRETVYFISLCYYKNNISNIVNLPEEFIHEICLIDNIISFIAPPYNNIRIKLNKLQTYQESGTFTYTHKLKDLKINEIYHNHFGHANCVGNVKYWLEEMSIAYNMDSYQRSQRKISYIKSIEVISNNRDKRIINSGTAEKIDDYRRDPSGNKHLRNIFDMYTSIEDLPISLHNIVVRMKLNNIPQIYARILTITHLLGIIIIAKGNGLKFLLFEPNDERSYFKVFFHKNDLNFDAYKLVCSKFTYLSSVLAKQDPQWGLLVKVHIPINSRNDIDHIKEHRRFNEYNTTNLQKLLILAVMNHDTTLIQQILRHGMDINYINALGMTPLMTAIHHNDTEIVKLLIQNNADVNIPDFTGKSPLYEALERFALEQIKLLVPAGAKIDNQHEKFNPKTYILTRPSTYLKDFVEKLNPHF